MASARLLLITSLALIVYPNAASSHDFLGFRNQGVKDTAMAQAAAAVHDVNASVSHSGSPGHSMSPATAVRAESVFLTAAAWNPHALTICFLSGSSSLRSRIVGVIKREWPIAKLTHDVLTYDAISFTVPPICASSATKADIRVGFLADAANAGYWSYIGQESSTYYPSMNFTGLDKAPCGNALATISCSPGEPDFTRIVAHEMGHALGLEHEHQSPTVSNCQWNYQAIYNNYLWQSYDAMLANFTQLQNSMNGQLPTYQVSPYDPTSVMHYYFDASYFLDGVHDACYIPAENAAPLSLDLAAITRAYLAPAGSRASMLTALKGALASPFVRGRQELQSLLKAKITNLNAAL